MGHHILSEMYGCEAGILNDRELIERLMVEAALEAGAEVREVVFHKFSPQGVSGVVVISESHLTIHTWPELGYAAVDVFTCGDKVNPLDACNYLFDGLRAKDFKNTVIMRGILDKMVPEPDKKNALHKLVKPVNKVKINFATSRVTGYLDVSKLISPVAERQKLDTL